MIKIKTGGLMLTGLAAFLIAGKAINSIDGAVGKVCEAVKWRNYYKCWSKGRASGEPIAPGYSITTRPAGADYDIVKDPEGKDHSKDGVANGSNNSDAVNAIIGAVKDVAEKAMDSLSDKVKRKEEALEGQTEASENDISDETKEEPNECVENVIDGLFEENDEAMDIPSEETPGTDEKETDE